MTVNEKGLEPCPFCGCVPVWEIGGGAVEPYYRHEWDEGCALSTFQFADAPEAIAAWNRRAASRDAEPVAWQYRYWYSSGEPGVWLSERREDADDLLESGVLIREETRALFTFQPDALVHVDGVTMTPTAAANRIAELSAAQADHSTAIEPVAASPGVPDGWKLVPVEPTEAMLHDGRLVSTEGAAVIYRAMLAAAPASPAPSPASEDVLRDIDRMLENLAASHPAMPYSEKVAYRQALTDARSELRALSSKQRSEKE